MLSRYFVYTAILLTLAALDCDLSYATNAKVQPSKQVVHQPTISFDKSSDIDTNLLEAFKSAVKEDYSKAVMYADSAKDRDFAVASVTAIKIYKDPTSYSLADIDEFLEKNQFIPKNLIEQKVEKIVSNTTDPDEVITWFAKHTPVTPRAQIYYVNAITKRGSGDSDESNKIFRSLWRTNQFDIKTEEFLLNQKRDVLTLSDCLEKIDFLSWNKSFTLANDLINFLPAKYQETPLKRLKALKVLSEGKAPPRTTNADFDDISYYFYIQKLIESNNIQKAVDVMAKINTKRQPEKWWKIRNRLTREALSKEQFEKAYIIAANHHLAAGPNFAEAEWLAGWIALRKMNNVENAINHFRVLYNNSKLANTKSKAAFWLARSYEEASESSSANEWYTAAAKMPATFYGQLASLQLGEDYHDIVYTAQNSVAQNANVDPKHTALFAYYLFLSDQKPLAYKVIAAMADMKLDRHQFEVIARFFNKKKQYALSVELARNLANSADTLILEGYPKPYKPVNNDHSEAIYFAIMRQESNFDQGAKSSAGAIGLMQLMPDTARLMAKKVGLNPESFKHDAKSNLLKGVAYIDHMYGNNNSYLLTIASYNAGPGNAKKWIEANGDPRGKSIFDKIDWIESIPFYETRNYVKKVIENAVVYEYNGDSKLMTSAIEKFLE